MQVILLERIGRLGQMGDVVTVKDGFARNFLLPQGKALRAAKANRERFEKERAQLEARNLELKSEAGAVAEKLQGKASSSSARPAIPVSYGSVTTRDISTAVSEGGFSIERRQVMLDRPIKSLGLHDVRIGLHAEVSTRRPSMSPAPQTRLHARHAASRSPARYGRGRGRGHQGASCRREIV